MSTFQEKEWLGDRRGLASVSATRLLRRINALHQVARPGSVRADACLPRISFYAGSAQGDHPCSAGSNGVSRAPGDFFSVSLRPSIRALAAGLNLLFPMDFLLRLREVSSC